MALTKRQITVLKQVVNELDINNICYQVTGGAAAILHGVDRETEDLDFDIAKRDVDKVRTIFRDNVTTDYHHYVGEDFDLWLITCEIDGVPVEFGQAEEAKILGTGNTNWTALPDTIADAETMIIDGISMKVQSKKDLIKYKRILGREVDKLDVAVLRFEPLD